MREPYIFNIGLNRAGTTSLAQALELLGIRTLHFRYRQRRLYEIIRENMQAKRPLLAGPDREYRAFSDFAGQYFFVQLDQCYPGSKFILTTRDLEGWLDSRERKVIKNRTNPSYRHNFLDVDRERWTAEYHALHREAKAFFAGRSESLLVINITAGEGWRPLCDFLGVPVLDVPFPNLNALPRMNP